MNKNPNKELSLSNGICFSSLLFGLIRKLWTAIPQSILYVAMVETLIYPFLWCMRRRRNTHFCVLKILEYIIIDSIFFYLPFLIIAISLRLQQRKFAFSSWTTMITSRVASTMQCYHLIIICVSKLLVEKVRADSTADLKK